MVEERRETVVVDGDRNRSPIGWIVGLVILVLLVAWFFMSGGFGMFGSGTGGGGSTNVNVQPTTGQ